MNRAVPIIAHDDRCNVEFFVGVDFIGDGGRLLPGSPEANQENALRSQPKPTDLVRTWPQGSSSGWIEVNLAG